MPGFTPVNIIKKPPPPPPPPPSASNEPKDGDLKGGATEATTEPSAVDKDQQNSGKSGNNDKGADTTSAEDRDAKAHEDDLLKKPSKSPSANDHEIEPKREKDHDQEQDHQENSKTTQHGNVKYNGAAENGSASNGGASSVHYSKFANPNTADLNIGEIHKVITVNDKTVVVSNEADTKLHTTAFIYPQQRSRALPPLDLTSVTRPADVDHNNEGDGEASSNKDKDRPFGLSRAPTVRPTMEEFKDPSQYISTISEIGKKHGMIKIIPPLDWNPPFCLDTEMFWFKTRRQTFNGKGEQIRQDFKEALYHFHKHTRNSAISKQPSIDKRELDLFRLHQSVQLKGGFDEVTNNKQWAQVGRELGYAGRIMTSLSTSLKSSYQRYLVPFEKYLQQHGVDITDGTKIAQFTMSKKRHLDNGGDDDDDKQDRDSENTPAFKRIKLENGSEVVMKVTKDCINRDERPRVLGSELSFHRSKPFIKTASIPDDPAIPPFDNWHDGLAVVDDYRYQFREAPSYNLKQFQQKAVQYKNRYFNSQNGSSPSSSDIEKEFWRVVTDANESIEVEYGADIPTAIQTSAFPQVERDYLSPYYRDPWNANAIPLNNKSYLRHVDSNVPYMVEPWLYVGMVFACQSWNFNDYYSYSVNYHHFGDCKTWYAVPESDFDKYQELAAKMSSSPLSSEGLIESDVMLSPDALKENGISVFALDQKPGEIVITFPKSYHAHLNHGFNLTEAVNLLPTQDWAEYGFQCLDLYRKFQIPPPFSIQKLLIDMAVHENNSNEELIEDISKPVAKIKDDEIELRSKVRQKYSLLREETIEEDKKGLQYCSISNDMCYLSRIVKGSGVDEQVISLDHFLNMPQIHEDLVHEYKMVYQYNDDALADIVNSLGESSNRKKPQEWYGKLAQLIKQNTRPPLNLLKDLVYEGERSLPSLEPLAPLRTLIERGCSWARRARAILNPDQSVEHKLEDLEQIYNEIPFLPVDLPEIEQIILRAEKVQEYCQTVDKLLDGKSPVKKIEEYEQLIEQGKQLNIELPEIENISRKVAQLKWVELVNFTIENDPDLDTLTNLIVEGLKVGITCNDETWQRLDRRKCVGQEMEAKAREALSGDLTRDQIEELIKQTETVPITKDLHAQLYKRLENNTSSSEKTTSGDQRPSYDDAIQMLEEARSMSSKPNIFALEKEIRVVQNWMRNGKRLFGKGNAPLYILKSHLSYVEKRNENCFSLEDRYRGKDKKFVAGDGENAGSEGESGDVPSSPRSFCLCRMPESGMMLECDVCHEWFHGRCLRVGRSKSKANVGFICPICDHRSEVPRDSLRPKLEELKLWLDAAMQLPLRPAELDSLQRVVHVAELFRDFLQTHVLRNDLSVGELRFYLCKLEGGEILLAEEANYMRRKIHELAPISDEPPPPIESVKPAKKQANRPAANLNGGGIGSSNASSSEAGSVVDEPAASNEVIVSSDPESKAS